MLKNKGEVMQINKINQTNFRGNITIIAKENTHKQYLYNELMDICRKHKLPANFCIDKVEFPSISDSVIEKIKALGIKIFSRKKV